METIEMDLMQAQIGELTTELAALKMAVQKLQQNGVVPKATADEAGYMIIVNNDGDYELFDPNE